MSATTPPPPSILYFKETGHSLGHAFLDFWRSHGDIQIFGFPISEEITEWGITVQYFERARFEWHPTNPVGQQVMLGRVGAELYARDHPAK